jgi:transcription elongation GreA/GreB family factor
VSRAFVREPDGDRPPEPLPDRPVSPHRNLVTPRGHALLVRELARLDAALGAAAGGDADERARLSRDRRYVAHRLATAETVAAAPGTDGEAEVAFGGQVTLALADGRRVVWRIVGEDEADPAHGRIAWTAPVAGLLTGLAAGDEVTLPAGPATVVAVDPRPEPLPDVPTGGSA